MEDHQKTYVYTKSGGRPSKRRRIDRDGLHSSWKLRQQTFDQLWSEQRQRIGQMISNSNEGTLDEVSSFMDDCANEKEHEDKVQAGFVLGGPSLSEHAGFLEQLETRVADGGSNSKVLVKLSSSECPNLRALLKTLIAKATAQRENDDDMDVDVKPRKGPKLLNYDLQLLHEWAQERKISQVIVAFQDSEAFDGTLLAEAIDIFRYVFTLKK
jgi:origin recognition complex subunit 3